MPEYIPPENLHGPEIRKALRSLARDIQKESGATRVIITCTFELNGTTEKASLKMSVSTDNAMERTTAAPPKPKGDSLINEAEKGIRKALDRRPGKKK